MSRHVKTTVITAFVASAALAATASAALTPVFKYQFPTSYDGSVNSVIDQSGAGNNATVNQGFPLALSSNIPAGAAGGTQSVDFNTTFGNINTIAPDLVSSAAVAAAGGFTYDIYFNPTGGNGGSGIRKVLDFAGTDFIGYDTVSGPGRVTIGLSGGQVANFTGAGIDAAGWNHVVVEFDTKGAPLVGGSVTGNLSVLINGVQRTLGTRTLTNFGDSLNRPTSIGRHPTGDFEHFRGLVYDPTVSLGVDNTPVLLGHWKLDEAVSPSAGQTAFDSSGNGLNGTFAGGTGPAPVAGQFGGAYDFNGSQNVNLGTQNLLTFQNDFTITAWIRPDALGGSQRILSHQPGLGGGIGFGLAGPGGDELQITTFGILDYTTSNVNIQQGQFQHVAVVFDDSNDAHFYLNGVLMQTIAGTSPANLLSSPMFIGSGGPLEFFNGAIDDVQIYRGTLTAEQIQAVMAGPSIPEPTTIMLLALTAGAAAMRRGRRLV